MSDVILCERGQITIPAQVCKALGLRTGDHPEVITEAAALVGSLTYSLDTDVTMS